MVVVMMMVVVGSMDTRMSAKWGGGSPRPQSACLACLASDMISHSHPTGGLTHLCLISEALRWGLSELFDELTALCFPMVGFSGVPVCGVCGAGGLDGWGCAVVTSR